MKFRESYIKGVVEIIPNKFIDNRGYFFESYNKQTFSENGLEMEFIQDNQSYSTPNVIRGLHFQRPPFAQGKLVRVIKGKILDIAVDLRPESPTFGKYDAIILDSDQCNMFYIPEGFAHGFAAIEESLVMYKCTNIYNKQSESGLIWNDPTVNIDWGIQNPLVSDKDIILDTFEDLIKSGNI